MFQSACANFVGCRGESGADIFDLQVIFFGFKHALVLLAAFGGASLAYDIIRGNGPASDP